MSSFTYAIGDLHGRLDLLKLAYEAIQAEADTGLIGTIIHLGDYVDRGPDSRGVVEFLMDEKTAPAGWERICLMGNHEEMMVMTVDAGLHPQWWIGNGGGATLISYGHERNGKYDPSVVPGEHIDWLKRRPYIKHDVHRLYVHAAVDPSKELEGQEREVLTWQRYRDDDPGWYRGLTVIHGHTPHADGPIVRDGRVNLDTHAYRTGRLAIAVFDDERAGSFVRLIEVEKKDGAA